ncbi:MAG: DUF2909 domain-containing protein [Psychrosphaera sp.]|nr:DUF2909 domain-containing protein [Psychrosphaera sp.]NQZ09200.1 DUF2909 domain-containing protein [Algicola sp.]
MVIKLVIIGLLLFVVFNLFRALFIMVKNDPNGPKMSTLIGRRLIFSVIAIIVIVGAMAFGLITPNPRPM